LGVLNLYTKEDHEFTDEEVEFLTAVAAQAAIAIHNARLHEETERRGREAEELARTARFLTETLDMSAVGERIVTSVRGLFVVEGATLRLLQPDGSLRHLASSGEVLSQRNEGNVVPSGLGLAGLAVTERKTICSADVLNDPKIRLTNEMRDFQARSGNRSMIAVPLRAHEKLIGTLTLSGRTGRSYSQNETALLQTFADQAALALENARLYEETARSKKELETTNQQLGKSLKQLGGFYTALTPIAPGASIHELIGGIIERLMAATGADSGLIRVWDKETNTLPIIGHRGFSDDYLKRVETAPPSGAVAWVIKHNEPIIAPDITSEPRF
jgi:GAF domain-containing protein